MQIKMKFFEIVNKLKKCTTNNDLAYSSKLRVHDVHMSKLYTEILFLLKTGVSLTELAPVDADNEVSATLVPAFTCVKTHNKTVVI